MGSFRDLYKNDVDFAALSLQSKEFAQYLKPNGQLDFNDSDAAIDDQPAQAGLRTRCEVARGSTLSTGTYSVHEILRNSANKEYLQVPNRRTWSKCSRLNYILWLHDIVESTSKTSNIGNDTEGKVIGLDMYVRYLNQKPQLELSLSSQVGRDVAASTHCSDAKPDLPGNIDENNTRTAQENVKTNQLESRIRVIKTDPKDVLFPLDKIEQKRYDYLKPTLTPTSNRRKALISQCATPPFYTSREEMAQSSESKSQQPSSVCTGADVEMVTKGGEVAFVTKMIDESLNLRDRIQWYTSMLGKLSSVTVLVEALIKHGNHNYAVTEFVQGSKTKRWALAWSWGDRLLLGGIPGFPKHLLPFPAEYNFTLPSEISIDDATTSMDKELESLRWFWEWDQTRSAGVGFAAENVWSRQARRKMKLAGQGGSSAKIDSVPDEVALGIRVEAKLVRGQLDSSNKNEVQIVIHWIQGMDSVLFESFCGMLKRKLESSKRQESER
ncbi:hypothetical protein N7481_011522 [Penicillium waksmanii]|uniref:uncharacterized protein n=1 Tax=Penicillium waksmanii TaxID=69791 RepID=UPI00254854B7|nr:uncharacterized protein N7481_011522 [Penicillium waksmanii]KAJ5974312.1 hypothetical protein N7481_011522 [Penicillium waksmanii]